MNKYCVIYVSLIFLGITIILTNIHLWSTDNKLIKINEKLDVLANICMENKQ